MLGTRGLRKEPYSHLTHGLKTNYKMIGSAISQSFSFLCVGVPFGEA